MTSRIHNNIIFTPFAQHQATVMVDKLLVDICKDLARRPINESEMGSINVEVLVDDRIEVRGKWVTRCMCILLSRKQAATAVRVM